jgi:hypothetical protein
METLDTRLRKRIHVSLYALLFLTGLLGLSVLLESCTDTCEVRNEMVYYKPVYTPLSELRASVESVAPQSIKTAGKIYIKDHWLFVNEPGQGIHVIDNSNPASPAPLHFINIPGNYDFAINNETLYADSFIDLVAIDISEMSNIHETSRLENVFPNYNTLGFYLDVNAGLVTEWVEQTDIKVYESDCDANIQPWGGIYYAEGIAVPMTSDFKSSAAIAPGNGSGPGVGGSMARFTINANYLYVLNGGDVETINIASAVTPVSEGKTPVSWDMETIFPYENNLFIGSRSGMHIVDISNPATPELISTYSHMRVCDPVVVQDGLAYVTLRSGTECEGFTNQLEVINIENLTSPQLVKTYAMTNPHGLGIDNNTLFVCDGDAGLKIYDSSDINNIDKNLLAHYDGINAYDVIPFNNLLVMTGADGIMQYDYSNPEHIKYLSTLEIAHETN